MTFIFCLDDNMGMLFNKRRQSSDAAVFADIAALISGSEITRPSFGEDSASGCCGITRPSSGEDSASGCGDIASSAEQAAGTLYITSFSEKLISSAGLAHTLWDGVTLPEELLPASTSADIAAENLRAADITTEDEPFAEVTEALQNNSSGSCSITNPFFFVENFSVKPFLSKADILVIYWWNRRYPGDFFLDFLPEEEGFCSVSKYDFSGKSHEKITKEIFLRQSCNERH